MSIGTHPALKNVEQLERTKLRGFWDYVIMQGTSVSCGSNVAEY